MSEWGVVKAGSGYPWWRIVDERGEVIGSSNHEDRALKIADALTRLTAAESALAVERAARERLEAVVRPLVNECRNCDAKGYLVSITTPDKRIPCAWCTRYRAALGKETD